MTLSGTLREQAEQRLSISEADIPGMTAEDIHKLIYELQVHQIELELQNEELRDAQAELAKAHDRFEDLYEFAPVGYVTLDRDGSILRANLTLARMLGVDRSELRETRLSNHISRGSQDTLYQHRLAVFADHEDEEAEPEILRHTCELELTTASGALLFVRLRCEYVPVDDDDAAYCRTTISDVTAQKIAELKIERFNEELEKQVALRTTELATANRKLITSEERLRTTLNTAGDSIITIDRLGIVQDVNQATIQLSGYAMDELVGQHLSVLMPPSYFEKHADFIGRYLTTGQAGVTGRVSKVTGQRKDGSTFPAELAVSEIPHLNLFTGIIRDLTEQQRLQRNVLSVAARERRRIGAELHDGLCQELAGIAMIADALVLSEPRKTEVNHARSISDGLKHAARHCTRTRSGRTGFAGPDDGLNQNCEAIQRTAGRRLFLRMPGAGTNSR